MVLSLNSDNSWIVAFVIQFCLAIMRCDIRNMFLISYAEPGNSTGHTLSVIKYKLTSVSAGASSKGGKP
jgi:hypothetical protein